VAAEQDAHDQRSDHGEYAGLDDRIHDDVEEIGVA
jgi:hypothetical protein